MNRSKPLAFAAVAISAALALSACSSSGGKKATESSTAASAGVANTPKMTVAMITHQAPGDTFWDIIRKGAEAASAKDNVDLQYSNDPDASQAGPADPGGDRQEGRRHRRDRPEHRGARRRDQEGDRRRHPGDDVQRRRH